MQPKVKENAKCRKSDIYLPVHGLDGVWDGLHKYKPNTGGYKFMKLGLLDYKVWFVGL